MMSACLPRPVSCGYDRAKPNIALGRRASFWVCAGVVAHTLWTSAAPAMTYRLYAGDWHLTHTVTTAIFAIYPIVVAAVLIGFGDVSDYIGRRATMLLGLGASLVGALFFAVAPNVVWVFAGRIFMGIGVGLTAGPSTAAMVEFSAEGQAKRAASITTAAQAAGFAVALLLGGALIEYAPWPLHLSFWVLFVVLAVLFAATWFLPRRTGHEAPGPWRPKTPSLPKSLRRTFAVAAAAAMTAYTHGVLILSLGGQVAHDLVGSPNAFINGAALSLFAIGSRLVAITPKAPPPPPPPPPRPPPPPPAPGPPPPPSPPPCPRRPPPVGRRRRGRRPPSLGRGARRPPRRPPPPPPPQPGRSPGEPTPRPSRSTQ